MRLLDFAISTSELDATRKLYLELDRQEYAVTSVALEASEIHLITDKREAPIDLARFRDRTASLPGATNLLAPSLDVKRLFGYRLTDGKILLS